MNELDDFNYILDVIVKNLIDDLFDFNRAWDQLINHSPKGVGGLTPEYLRQFNIHNVSINDLLNNIINLLDHTRKL